MDKIRCPTPADEAERLDVLRSLGLLDTNTEERFDRLTRLARRMFAVPIAVVSLVDKDRQWFKSIQGLEARETPRDISFCGHAIMGDDVFAVPDATQDGRFADNPLVTGDPSIRFYAGCPIVIQGKKIGTLCVIDRSARDFGKDDIAALSDLTKMVEQEITSTQIAGMDDLTQITNRRGFMVLGQQAFALSVRMQLSHRVLMFNLDSLKKINDEHGHAASDAALVAFANILKATFHASDVVARLADDQFAVFESGRGGRLNTAQLTNLRENLQNYNQNSGKNHPLTYRTVIVEKQDYDTTLLDMLKRAEETLYREMYKQNA